MSAGKFPAAVLIAALPLLMSCQEKDGEKTSQTQVTDEKAAPKPDDAPLRLNARGYFEKAGLNVMAFSDSYPEGHQGGVTIVQHGVRVAANGDVRLEPAPGQWQPVPKLRKREVDKQKQVITVRLSYPDPALDRRGFNPIIYPDLTFAYRVHVKPRGGGFRIVVNLEKPLPKEWVGKVGFNLELFPGELFGKAFYMDDKSGIFPRQLNGPMYVDDDENHQSEALAEGRRLVVAPEVPERRMTIEAVGTTLKLLDGRAQHNNGWFIVRSELKGRKSAGALEWNILPNTIPGWVDDPVIHVSQVGYHPKQTKTAVIELDKRDKNFKRAKLYRVTADGKREELSNVKREDWGGFLRYHYLRLDFTNVRKAGLYLVTYGDHASNVFRIGGDVFARHVWQPTLEYFLPVQMCHMRVNDRYRVWHGLCHLDDARMAPVNINHFDGYTQGSSTLTKYRPRQPVPGLNVGGWHDAGDYDLRVESQISTVRILSQIYEAFAVDYDATTIDQSQRLVELHRPDQVPDVLQQIEHGVLSVLGGYQSLGRLYRGIICPAKRQYTLLGDGSTVTDNRVFDPKLRPGQTRGDRSGTEDDRLVFTEENPARELQVAAGLAAAARVLKGYKPELGAACIDAAEAIYEAAADTDRKDAASKRIEALAELILTTEKEEYKEALVARLPEIKRDIEQSGWVLGRVMKVIDNPDFAKGVRAAVKDLHKKTVKQGLETPFGVPYKPKIWGAGWGIQKFGVRQYFLHTGWPDIFDKEYMLHALNFVLGSHPGRNTTSFVSGVGSRSLTVGYGANRADWGYIPGGVGSGTGLIRPDLAELKEWPFLWQQAEYVVGGGGTNFMFLALAAHHLLNSK